MRSVLLDLLVCPACQGALQCGSAQADGEEIVSGRLECARCRASYPIVNGIPRFVPSENYADSFGFQWNTFAAEQIDSANRTGLSERRFFTETGWTPAWMRGKWLLEGGCGAGRFMEVATRTEAQVVGVDLSNAVDAARATLRDRPNAHFVQASLYQLPFRPGTLDGCYCIGVLQHTPDRESGMRALARLVKPAGKLAVTVYEKRRWTRWNAKYWVRPITKRLPKRLLLALIRGAMPVMFPLTEILFRIPVLKRVFQFTIPVANYVDNKDLTMRMRYRWAVLDTFDMLSPQFDEPLTEPEMRRWLQEESVVQVQRLPNPGLNLVGDKGGR